MNSETDRSIALQQPYWLANLLAKLKLAVGNQCLICRHATADVICADCKIHLPRVHHPCTTCGIELFEPAADCGDCLKLPKPYRRTIAPFAYAHPIRDLIGNFKQHTPWPHGKWLADSLYADVSAHYQPTTLPDLITFVPSHRRKLFRRGYNPAHILAAHLARRLQLPCEDILQRIDEGVEQKTLRRSQRLRNLRKAFHCKRNLDGLKVAVVDDVVTTCSTAIAVAHKLRQQGVAQVDVWAIARTL